MAFEVCGNSLLIAFARSATRMVGGLIGIAAVAAGGYYLSRVIPRAAARAAAASSGAAVPRHQRYRKYETAFHPVMTEHEALLVLGFDESTAHAFQGPSKDAVRERYRQVMAELHSDVSGSSFVAMKINEARDVLLK